MRCMFFARERHETARCAVTKGFLCARKARNAARCAASRKNFRDGVRSEPFGVFRAQKIILFALFSSFAANALADLPDNVADMVDSWPSYRFMTYNIQYCNHTNSVEGGAAWQGYTNTEERIDAEAPDFLALNEVSFALSKYDDGQNQATLLANALGMHATEGRAGSSGNIGVAILSKEEPLSSFELSLPKTSPTNSESKIGYENRKLLMCEFTNFWVATVHMDTYVNWRTEYGPIVVSNLNAKAEESAKPIFFMGDWNTTPTATEFLPLVKETFTILSPTNGVRTYTGRKTTGGSIIDYIALTTSSTSNFYVTSTHVTEDLITSDHNPVVVDVAMIPTNLGWVCENTLTTGMTGSWSPAIEYYTDGTAELSGTNTFTAASASAGTPVTVTLTAEMSAPADDWTFDAGDDAQAAIRLGTNGYFQVWTSSGWLDTTTAGTSGAEYTLQTVFDYVKGKYSVFIYDADSGDWAQIQTAGGTSAFPLANAGVSFLSSVVFAGETVFTSLYGTYVEITGFQAEDALTLLNSSTNLTWALATWLNACTNGTGDVATTVAAMSADDFAKSYLINLDLSVGTGYSFEITDVTMGEESVTLSVTLTRDGKAEQAVNGTLKFYTSADVATGYEEAGSATLSDDDFSAGDTATATIPLGTDAAKFYKAVIE